MAAQISNYQCPACTGPLSFNTSTGRLECEYCGSTFSEEEVQAMFADKDAAANQAAAEAQAKAAAAAADSFGDESEWNMADAGSDWGADAGNVSVYNCPSCGAELIFDNTTAATSCPYCDNPTIVPSNLSGCLKPDYIIPFKLDKKAAIEALNRHYKGKKLLPDAFTANNHVEEVKGVYVPFWLFDGKAFADVTFRAENTHVRETSSERISTTDHYIVRRTGDVAFRRIPVDASTKMPDDHMDSIEPFDYSELKEFSTAYLPGFMADKYDVSVEDSAERADERARNSAYEVMREDVIGYQSVIGESKKILLKRGKVQYALLPVWMLTTKWNNEFYLFAMNGQTGKFVGDLPIDKGKKNKYFWITYVICAAICGAISFLLLK